MPAASARAACASWPPCPRARSRWGRLWAWGAAAASECGAASVAACGARAVFHRSILHPHLLPGQAKQLGVLRAVAEGRADQPLHFCWFEAGAAAPPAARGFAAALGLDGGQVPALVAVAPKKERSAIMTARFEKVRWWRFRWWRMGAAAAQVMRAGRTLPFGRRMSAGSWRPARTARRLQFQSCLLHSAPPLPLSP